MGHCRVYVRSLGLSPSLVLFIRGDLCDQGKSRSSATKAATITGVRPSEHLALTWTDFNLEHGTASVSKYSNGGQEDRGSRTRNENWLARLVIARCGHQRGHSILSCATHERNWNQTRSSALPSNVRVMIFRESTRLMTSAKTPSHSLMARFTWTCSRQSFPYQKWCNFCAGGATPENC